MFKRIGIQRRILPLPTRRSPAARASCPAPHHKTTIVRCSLPSLFSTNTSSRWAVSYKSGKADNEEHKLTNWKDETSGTNLTYTAGGKDSTYSLFAQDEIMILNNLTAYAGFRQDWWETKDGYANSIGAAGYPKSYDARSASSFSPKFAIVYKPFDKTSVRSSVGKAFRAPTVYELYRTWRSSTGVTYNGNPDLKPETITLGHQHRAGAMDWCKG